MPRDSASQLHPHGFILTAPPLRPHPFGAHLVGPPALVHPCPWVYYIQYTHGCIRLYWWLSRVEIGAHLVGPPAPVHPRRQVVHHHHRPLLLPRPPLQLAATPPRQRLRGRPGPGGGRAGIGPGGGQDGAVADVGGGLDRVVTAVTGP